jgi:hypothetical protein
MSNCNHKKKKILQLKRALDELTYQYNVRGEALYIANGKLDIAKTQIRELLKKVDRLS